MLLIKLNIKQKMEKILRECKNLPTAVSFPTVLRCHTHTASKLRGGDFKKTIKYEAAMELWEKVMILEIQKDRWMERCMDG